MVTHQKQAVEKKESSPSVLLSAIIVNWIYFWLGLLARLNKQLED